MNDNEKEALELIKGLTEDQAKQVIYFIAAIKASRKKISPKKLISVIDNWESLEKLIFILK